MRGTGLSSSADRVGHVARFILLLAVMVVIGCTRKAPRKDVEAGSATSAPTIEQAVVPDGAGGPPPASESEAARERRADLVRSIAAKGYVKSPRVLDAMKRVPRHLFIEGVPLDEAYDDSPVPIGSGQTISQPTVVGMMTEALELRGKERVLEIGTGSGYQTAILSLLAKDVYSIEVVPALGERAEKRLRDLGYANVHVRVGNGYAGWPEKAPFDRILLTAAPPEVPQALLDQLADGGILVAPVGERGMQVLVRIKKQDGKLTREELDIVSFVPMIRK
jgi:protein-L-isoaspartate(D-aspartate) O-methyltransferase